MTARPWINDEPELRRLAALGYSLDQIALGIDRTRRACQTKLDMLKIPYKKPAPVKAYPMDVMPRKSSAQLRHGTGTPVEYEDMGGVQ